MEIIHISPEVEIRLPMPRPQTSRTALPHLPGFTMEKNGREPVPLQKPPESRYLHYQAEFEDMEGTSHSFEWTVIYSDMDSSTS
uniref:Uncharacterized protein n=1 Tax=Sphaerodactylus townsendi TaxID=933632 RepID=A0ACB8FTU5_9SAUR